MKKLISVLLVALLVAGLMTSALAEKGPFPSMPAAAMPAALTAAVFKKPRLVSSLLMLSPPLLLKGTCIITRASQ